MDGAKTIQCKAWSRHFTFCKWIWDCFLTWYGGRHDMICGTCRLDYVCWHISLLIYWANFFFIKNHTPTSQCHPSVIWWMTQFYFWHTVLVEESISTALVVYGNPSEVPCGVFDLSPLSWSRAYAWGCTYTTLTDGQSWHCSVGRALFHF